MVTASGQDEFCANLNAARPDGCRLQRIPGALHELFVERDEHRLPALGAALDFIEGSTAP